MAGDSSDLSLGETPELRVDVSLLGGFRVEINGQSTAPMGSRIARSLFARLLTAHDQHHMRARLAGAFWPDTSESTARQRLSRALWQIRTACGDAGPDILEQQRDWVSISPMVGVTVDVVEYERLLSLADRDEADSLTHLATAVDLYRGDFLPGHYEDWVIEEQDRLRIVQRAALRRLVTLYQSKGSLEQALVGAKRLVAIDPLDEDAHRLVMRLCVLLRRPEEALRQFRECRSIFAAELGTGPSRPTIELAEEVNAQLSQTSTPRPDRHLSLSPVFVARERERDEMIAALDHSLASEGSVILLEGAAGIGKSSLISQISDDARWRNIEVLSYGYDDTTATGAYEAIRHAVAPAITPLRAEQLADAVEDVWLAEAARVIPSVVRARREFTGSRLEADDDRWRVREAITQVLLSLAQLQPTLLVLEDVHWADVDTLEVVERLARVISGTSLVICLAYRHEEAQAASEIWETLTRIHRHAATRRIALRELGRADVLRLVTALGGISTTPEVLTDQLMEHTGGNPLFVVETIKSLLIEEPPTESLGLPEQMPLASSVSEIVQRRLARLSPAAIDVVGATAIYGRPTSVDELVSLTGRERSEVLSGLLSAVQLHVLLDTETGCVFSHNLVKRVVYDGVAWNTARKLHRRSAALLEGIAAPPAEIAHHLHEARVWNEAMRFSKLAGDEARAVAAFQTAAEHYGRALQAFREDGNGDPTARDLIVEYEIVADILADRDLQRSLLAQLDELSSSPIDRAYLCERLALLEARTDAFDAALETTAAGLAATVAADVDGSSLVVVEATIHQMSGHPDRTIDLLLPVVHLLEDNSLRAEGNYTLATALAELRRYDEARKALDESLAAFVVDGDKCGEARVRMTIGTVLGEMGMVVEADASLTSALDAARAVGYRHGEALTLINLAVHRTVTAQPGSALKLFDLAESAFASIDNQRGVAFALANRATLLVELIGDVDGAISAANRALAYFEPIEHATGVALCRTALASGAKQSGHPERAIEIYRSSIDDLERHGATWLGAQLLRSLGRTYVDVGRYDEAAGVLEQAEQRLSTNDALLPSIWACRAQIARARDDEAAAHELAVRALDALTEYTENGHRIAFRSHLAMGEGAPEAVRALDEAHRRLTLILDQLDDSQRARAEQLPDHAAILAAHAVETPTTVAWSVPSADAPGGRPLTDDDMVSVDWTVWDPSDAAICDAVARRRHQITRLVREAEAAGAVPTVKDLAQALEVSRATVKRDIAAIRKQGETLVTRGSRG